MNTSEEENRPVRNLPEEGLESPFLNEELFAGERREADWEARLGVLEAESPFVQINPQSFEEEIIGKDERALVTDSLKIPNRWICAIDILIDNPKWGSDTNQPQYISKSRGTGILIGPRYVLTARHILDKQTVEVDGEKKLFAVKGLTVSPARNGSNSNNPFGMVKSKAVQVSRPYFIRRRVRQGSRVIEIPLREHDDYMLIILEKDLATSTHSKVKGVLGYWGQDSTMAVIRRLDPDTIHGKGIVVIGYPGDTCGKDRFSGSKAEKEKKINYCWNNQNDVWASTQWRGEGILEVVENSTTVFHTADTYEGQSGGPICRTIDQKLHLVGLHTAYDSPQRNKGVRVTRRMLRELSAWMNADAGTTIATIQDDTLIVQPKSAAGAGAKEFSDEFLEAEWETEDFLEILGEEAPEDEEFEPDRSIMGVENSYLQSEEIFELDSEEELGELEGEDEAELEDELNELEAQYEAEMEAELDEFEGQDEAEVDDLLENAFEHDAADLIEPEDQKTESGEEGFDPDGEFDEATTVESTKDEMGERSYDAVLFEHQTGGGGIPSWVGGIEPFPITPTLAFHVNEPEMERLFAPILVSPVRNLCAALVDLTGNPVTLPYAGLNDDELVFAGSMVKICAMYAAFALRSQVQAFVDAAAARGASVIPPGITNEIEKAWKPKLQALFPPRPFKSFGNKQDITFPKLDKIFTFSTDGKVDFARATPALSDAQLDQAGEFGTPKGKFYDWMRLMLRWSNNTAASNCILALGYFYINGALGQAGFFDSTTSNGLWLSADYARHDWVKTAAEKNANAAGQSLTPRWATAQRRQRSNITATATQTARFMALLALGKLVSADTKHTDPGAEMRMLMQAAIKCVPHGKCGIGSYVKDALRAAGHPFTALAAKKGFGDDSFSHECAIVERTVDGKDLRYVVVGLGSAPNRKRRDLSDLFVRLDQVIVARNR